MKFVSKWTGRDLQRISTFLLLFGAFCQQGTNDTISKTSTRFLIVFLFIASLLAHNFYTSVVVSTLVEIDYDSSVTNLNELSESDIPVGFFNTTVVKNLMKMTSDENSKTFLRKRVYESGQNFNSFFMGAYEGFERVRKGHFAFYCEEPVAQIIIPKLFDPHEIYNLNRIGFQSNDLVGIIVRKSSPLRERFLINWIRLSEAGIYHKIIKHWNNPQNIDSFSRAHFEGVRFEYVVPIFFCLLLAQVFTMLLLFVEIIIDYCQGE